VAVKPVLQLAVTCAEGREAECAAYLASQIQGCHWAILAALAAELVQEHERRQGARAVLVVGSAAQAERVLADLGRR
jgi:hypothetical protein